MLVLRIWTTLALALICDGTFGLSDANLSLRHLSLTDDHPGIHPVIPFCRKGFVMSTLSATQTDDDDSDRIAQRIFMFGGKGHNYVEDRYGLSMLKDIWTLHIENAGFKWTELSTPYASPTPRWKANAAVWNCSLYMVGGEDKSGEWLNDLWMLSLTKEPKGWMQLREKNDKQVLGRRSHGMGIFPNGRLVIFGGRREDHSCMGDLWWLDLTQESLNWSQGREFPSICRWGMSSVIVVDPKDNKKKIAVFGGRYLNSWGTYAYFDDIWMYEPVDDVWHQQYVASDVTPIARNDHACVYIQEFHSMYVYGGQTGDDIRSVQGDMWVFSFLTEEWKQLLTTGSSRHSPLPRSMTVATVWRGSTGDGEGALVIFGGEGYASGGEVLMSDVWMYTPSTDTWREVSSGGCSPGDDGVVVVKIFDISHVMWLVAALSGTFLVLVLFGLWHQRRVQRRMQYTAIN